MSAPPPNGVYVPAVLFFDEHDDLDISSIQKHVLRLAQVGQVPSKFRLLINISYRAGLLEYWCKVPMEKLNICKITRFTNQQAIHTRSYRSREERRLMIHEIRRTLNINGYEKVLVIAGTGTPSTRETIELCKDAQQAGASHALVLTPSVWPKAMTRENIIRFYTQVCIFLLSDDFNTERSPGCQWISDPDHDLQFPNSHGWYRS